MRVFIAVNLPEEIKDYIETLQKKIVNDYAKVSWVKKVNWHLTIKFIGDLDKNKLEFVKDKLSKIKFKGFQAGLDCFGVFPNMNYIRVIFIKLQGRFNELQKEIDSSLSDLFEKDNRFSAHVTLGRVKFVKDRELLIEKLKIEVLKKTFEVSEFCLMNSELSREGAKYTILETYKLN